MSTYVADIAIVVSNDRPRATIDAFAVAANTTIGDDVTTAEAGQASRPSIPTHVKMAHVHPRAGQTPGVGAADQ